MRLLSLSSRLLIDEQETNLFRRCPEAGKRPCHCFILDRVLTSTVLHGRLLYRRGSARSRPRGVLLFPARVVQLT